MYMCTISSMYTHLSITIINDNWDVRKYTRSEHEWNMCPWTLHYKQNQSTDIIYLQYTNPRRELLLLFHSAFHNKIHESVISVFGDAIKELCFKLVVGTTDSVNILYTSILKNWFIGVIILVCASIIFTVIYSCTCKQLLIVKVVYPCYITKVVVLQIVEEIIKKKKNTNHPKILTLVTVHYFGYREEMMAL